MFLEQGGLQGPPYEVRSRATRVLQFLFPKSNPAELNRCTFYFLMRAMSAIGKQTGHKGSAMRTAYEEAAAMRDGLKDAMDSLSELNEQDLITLQGFMGRQQQLELMISNIMKESSDTASTLAGSLKA